MAPGTASPGGPGAAPPTPEQMMQMMAMPMAPPPPGIVPNFTNPDSRVDLAIGLCSTIVGIMVFFVALRMYIKGFVTKAIGLEDWACLCAAILNFGYAAVIYLVLIGGGVGVHAWDLQMGTVMKKPYFQRLIASQSIYPIVVLFTKLSVLLLVYRIFKANNVAKYLCWLGITICTLFYTTTFILTLVWCAPKPGGDPMVSASASSCQDDANLVSSIQAGFNIGSDLYLLLIPIPPIMKLKTTMAKKVRIAFIFALGLLATVCSGLTLNYRIQTLRTVDVSWIYIPVIICSIFELNIGLICACLPCIPALLKSERIQSFLSIRTWSIFTSRGGSTSNLYSGSKDSHKRSQYSDIEKLKDGSASPNGSTTVYSVELKEGRPYHAREHV
ncbi:hypothetical protein P154DRAFT_604186 [Amniculicola lignicola CBS 123094]|uniref:Rhodopsin domain-containing protein n=1 Tax=Amniculicola lignicola CBS 123094 TaxID=1392246 RepID=A0A6A5WBF6_9PLEO|nr:hypothetical protein P154DRAFT_604186 [Amniculicola lignicola CBS 123094]